MRRRGREAGGYIEVIQNKIQFCVLCFLYVESMTSTKRKNSLTKSIKLIKETRLRYTHLMLKIDGDNCIILGSGAIANFEI